MKTTFYGKKISGILGVLPEKVSYFDDEISNYDLPSKQTLRLKRKMGFEKHRLAKESSTASDFCIYGLDYLIQTEKIKKEEIGAIVVVTLSPDYFIPHISNIIHGKCGLSEGVFCIDIAQGCCGFLYGLMQSYMLLEILKDKKVLLFNADVLCHKVSKRDRNSFPLMGDATAISVIENDERRDKAISFEIYSDGSMRDTITIPAGGFAMPSTEETAKLITMEDGNIRALDHFHMDGIEVFHFVRTRIPSMIERMLNDRKLSKDDIDFYLFHQPNRFMLKKLADKLKLPEDKLFMNIVENYGNPAGASIPINVIHNLGERIIENEYLCCLSAFGSGLAWGSMIMEIGNMNFCEMVESPL